MCEVGREDDADNQLKFHVETLIEGSSGDVILVHNEAAEGQLKFYAETPVVESSTEISQEETSNGQLKFHAETLEAESSDTILAQWNTDEVRALSMSELLAQLEADPIVASRFTARNPAYSRQLALKDPKVPLVGRWHGKSKARMERRSQEMDRKRRGEEYPHHDDSKRARFEQSPANYHNNRNSDSRNSYGYGHSYGHSHGYGHGHGYYNRQDRAGDRGYGHDRNYDRNHDRSYDRGYDRGHGYDRGYDRNRDRRYGGHDRHSNSHSNDRV